MNRSLSLVMLAAGLVPASLVAPAALLAQTAPAARPSATAAAPAAPAAAAPVPAPVAIPAKIAIIAFQPGVAQTNEGQKAFADVQRKYEPTQAKLKGLSDEIDSLKKQLASTTEKLTDEERASRTRTIDTKEKQLQLEVEDASGKLQGEMGDVYQKLAAKVYETVQSYAQQNGYTMVVDISGQQSPVLWADSATDITAAIIQAYNVKSGVPSQPVNAPAPTRSATPRSTTPARPSTTKPKP